jgi:hypothetical protein
MKSANMPAQPMAHPRKNRRAKPRFGGAGTGFGSASVLICVQSGVHHAEAQGSFGSRTLSSPQRPDFPRMMEMAKKVGLEILPPEREDQGELAFWSTGLLDTVRVRPVHGQAHGKRFPDNNR